MALDNTLLLLGFSSVDPHIYQNIRKSIEYLLPDIITLAISGKEWKEFSEKALQETRILEEAINDAPLSPHHKDYLKSRYVTGKTLPAYRAGIDAARHKNIPLMMIGKERKPEKPGSYYDDLAKDLQKRSSEFNTRSFSEETEGYLALIDAGCYQTMAKEVKMPAKFEYHNFIEHFYNSTPPPFSGKAIETVCYGTNWEPAPEKDTLKEQKKKYRRTIHVCEIEQLIDAPPFLYQQIKEPATIRMTAVIHKSPEYRPATTPSLSGNHKQA